MKRYFVCRYMQICAKFAIDAETHRDAITRVKNVSYNIERFIEQAFVTEDEEKTVESGTLIRIDGVDQGEGFLVDEAGDHLNNGSTFYDENGNLENTANAAIPRVIRENRVLASDPANITDEQREELLSSISSVLRAIS